MNETLLFTSALGFEAARRVDLLPDGHRSRRLHGHSFQADLRCALPAEWADFAGNEVAQLNALLVEKLAPLDYVLLNEHLQNPTDENLARWLRGQLELPGLRNVGIQSTRHQGVDLDENDHAHVWRKYVFEAAHQLPKVASGHKCGRMHGHGFEIIVHANQNLANQNIGVTYEQLDACWAPLHDQLHMACLNNIPGLSNPTSEVISAWIWDRLKQTLPELSWVTVYETASAGAHFDGKNYRIWKEQTFDSAVSLPNAPPEHRSHGLHGHTYNLRLHLCASLDETMGWTVDYGDVKERFKPVLDCLDHRLLNELPGIASADVASLAQWIRTQAAQALPQLDRIDLYETRGCGVILSWGNLGPALPV